MSDQNVTRDEVLDALVEAGCRAAWSSQRSMDAILDWATQIDDEERREWRVALRETLDAMLALPADESGLPPLTLSSDWEGRPLTEWARDAVSRAPSTVGTAHDSRLFRYVGETST